MTENKGLLEIITEDIGLAVEGEFKTQKNYMKQMLDNMYKENIYIWMFLDLYTPPADQKALYCGEFVYRCLEKVDSILMVDSKAFIEVTHEATSSGGDEYAEGIIKRLHEDNEWLADYIVNLAHESAIGDRIKAAGAVVYRFIEKQAEINVLKKPIYSIDPKKYPLTYLLRKRLNIAIATENFEIAAELRDKINAMGESLNQE